FLSSISTSYVSTMSHLLCSFFSFFPSSRCHPDLPLRLLRQRQLCLTALDFTPPGGILRLLAANLAGTFQAVLHPQSLALDTRRLAFQQGRGDLPQVDLAAGSYKHLRADETSLNSGGRLRLEKKKVTRRG
ncbi:hypothetical protein, partial [Pseudomonas aeruginosa]|uniref:hypothetical protein n=1 Tax=Pseudomonas aeruginosa TaxID=287 RepID=UPI0015C4FBC6